MSEIDVLLEDIENLKANLNELIDEKKGNLQDPDILTASHILNSVITEYNKLYLINSK